MSTRKISVDNQAGGSPEAKRLEELVGRHLTLQQVLEWTNSHEPPLHDVEVVTQDEFTHDVIVTVAEKVYLVYDAT